jgi:hypothetical protein
VRLRDRNSEPEQALKSAQDSLTALSGRLTGSRILIAGLVAGGVAGLTAGSAAISSLRRRIEGGARDDS